MKTRYRIISAGIALAVLLAGCGNASSGSPDNGTNSGAGSETEPGNAAETPSMKAVDDGTVVSKDGNRWLITDYIEQDGTTRIDAFLFTVNEGTDIVGSDGRPVAADDIAVGAQVNVWHTGTVQESYPAQATAAKIERTEPSEPVPDGMVDRATAAAAAIATLTEPSFAVAVKDATLEVTDDAEHSSGVWTFELVRQEQADQPIVVRIDARSGEPVRTPVAENDAFRVFAPAPDTEVGSTFTVEGEARVFEAAFSWTLDDGHTILAEGHEMADGGAPAWGRFSFDVAFEHASQPNVMLTLFIHSAKDGSVEKELIIPLKVPEDLVKYGAEE